MDAFSLLPLLTRRDRLVVADSLAPVVNLVLKPFKALVFAAWLIDRVSILVLGRAPLIASKFTALVTLLAATTTTLG